MIRVPYTLADLDIKAQAFKLKMDTIFNISVILNGWPAGDLAKPVMRYLYLHLDKIMAGRPSEFESHIATVDRLITVAKTAYMAANPKATNKETKAAANKWFKDQIGPIFNYDHNSRGFTKAQSGKMAYDHALDLALPTCPYCNAQFTFTIKNAQHKTRPHFDHFVNKAKHPYLALSFYNLVPACYVCNSNLKGAKKFRITTHLHPFIDQMEGIYRFRTNIKAVDFLVNKKQFKLVVEPCPGATLKDKRRTSKSLKIFAIEDRYQFHKDYAEEVLKKAYFYNDSNIASLYAGYQINGHPIFDPQDIKELILGNFIHVDRFHKRILAKITKDIAEEFGLII